MFQRYSRQREAVYNLLSATDTEADQAKADVAAQCLQAYNGNINDIAASIVEQTNDLRGITLLANRRATDKADVVFEALKKAFSEDKDKAKKMAEIMYDQARIISGLPLDDPVAYSDMVLSLF